MLVESDRTASELLASTLGTHGFSVQTARGVEEALEISRHSAPRFAIVDLCVPGGSALDLVAKLRAADPRIQIVAVTAYPSVAIAVAAIKRGASDYLIKPVDADQILTAFRNARGEVPADPSFEPLTIERMEWKHLQRMLRACNGNISEAARRLKMHRRTLQRKLMRRGSKRG